MARGKRKKKAVAKEPPPKKVKTEVFKISELAVIKRSLKNSLRGSENEIVSLRDEIERNVIEMTKTLKAGCTNLHVSLYSLYNTGTRQEIEKEFKECIGKNDQFFSDYFRGLLMIDGMYAGYKLHPTVKRLCNEYAVNPPHINGIGNMYNYCIKKYHVNFMNSICVHAYNRIRKFCYTKTRSKKRVYDTLHYLFHYQSEKIPDAALLEAIEHELKPIDFGDGAGYFTNMESRWYRYVPMFMELQK